MIEKLQQNKRSVTILLALVGIAIMTAYNLCAESCTYLRGSMFRVDLKYLGMLYMGMILVFGAIGKDAVCVILLSFGVAGEAFLLGYRSNNCHPAEGWILPGQCLNRTYIINIIMLTQERPSPRSIGLVLNRPEGRFREE